MKAIAINQLFPADAPIRAKYFPDQSSRLSVSGSALIMLNYSDPGRRHA